MKSEKTPLRRQPQQKRSQKRVEQILDAAAIVFDEVAFEAATTHAIAKRANTAVGSLYQFFPDKLAIFNALELRHVERVYVMWDKLLRPEVIQLPFADFIHANITQVEQLFTNPTSRIVFIQFFTSPTIFRNIDISFTQEAIQFMAKLLKARNPRLTSKRSQVLAEICINATNTLILLALRSHETHSQEIIAEIEALMRAYLKADIGDEAIANNSNSSTEKLTRLHHLNQRQRLILDYATTYLNVTIKNCEAMFPDVSRRTLQRDLKILSAQKLLLVTGKTDQRCYCFNSDSLN
ncbi:MAG TPA: TetR/AcrR family transcriptional regulator [Coleofasciculaceae cyanobacterium]|jgi:AcrR family transcriptional regulator